MKITSSLLGWPNSSELLNTNKRSSLETSPRFSKLVSGHVHVHSNLGLSIPLAAYNRAVDHVSGKCAPWYDILRNSKSSSLRYFVFMLVPKAIEEFTEVRDSLTLYLELFPLSVDIQVAFLFKSAARPETIPACLTTIKLIQSTNQGFISELWMISYHAKSIRENFHQIRQLYEINDIQNKIPDGRISFPEDSRSLTSGVAVEFRFVHYSSNPFTSQVAGVFVIFVCLEMSPSAIPTRKILRSVMCRLRLRRASFA
jgi:hypothetical protein